MDQGPNSLDSPPAQNLYPPTRPLNDPFGHQVDLMSGTRRRRNLACMGVLLTEFFERLAFYSLTANLVLYLTRRPLEWNAYNAAFLSLLTQGFCYFSSFFFGWLSDACITKFKLLTCSLIIYCFAYAFVPLLFPYYPPFAGVKVSDHWQWSFLAPLNNFSLFVCHPFNFTNSPSAINISNSSTTQHIGITSSMHDYLYRPPESDLQPRAFPLHPPALPFGIGPQPPIPGPHGPAGPSHHRPSQSLKEEFFLEQPNPHRAHQFFGGRGWRSESEQYETPGTCKSLFRENCNFMLLPLLIVIMLCTGAIKATLVPFGAQQLLQERQEVTRTFLNWFYWMTNAGSFIAFTVIAYSQQSFNVFIGYMVPCVSLIIGLFIFLIGRIWYRVGSDQEYGKRSLFNTVMAMLFEACMRHKFLCCFYQLRRRKILRPIFLRRDALERSVSGLSHATHGSQRSGPYGPRHSDLSGGGVVPNGFGHLQGQQPYPGQDPMLGVPAAPGTQSYSNGYTTYGTGNMYPAPPGQGRSDTPHSYYGDQEELLSDLEQEGNENSRQPLYPHSNSNLIPNRALLPPFCLDLCKQRYGGSYTDQQVEEVKSTGAVVAVFLVWIPYWVVYFQMMTTFFMQATHMRLGFGSNVSSPAAPLQPPKFSQQILNQSVSPIPTTTETDPDMTAEEFAVPAASLTVFNTIALLVCIPLMDRMVYPLADKYLPGLFSLRRRMLIGQCFSLLAIFVAAVVEYNRRLNYWGEPLNEHYNGSLPFTPKDPPIYQVFSGTVYMAANMSVFWLIPQYFLLGLAELFNTIAGLEFACRRAPPKMAAVIMGLYWCAAGLGSFLGSILLMSVRNWLFFTSSKSDSVLGDENSDINYRGLCPPPPGRDHPNGNHPRPPPYCESRLDIYFVLLAGLQGLGIFLFYMLSYRVIDMEATHSQCSYLNNEGLGTEGAGSAGELFNSSLYDNYDYDSSRIAPSGLGPSLHVNEAFNRSPHSTRRARKGKVTPTGGQEGQAEGSRGTTTQGIQGNIRYPYPPPPMNHNTSYE